MPVMFLNTTDHLLFNCSSVGSSYIECALESICLSIAIMPKKHVNVNVAIRGHIV